MVVVDSSALIPLSWVGRLDLISAPCDEIRTTERVRDEVLTEGKRGTAALKSFLTEVTVCETPPEAADVASLEGIAVADASVILLADDGEELLLANDKALVNCLGVKPRGFPWINRTHPRGHQPDSLERSGGSRSAGSHSPMPAVAASEQSATC